MMQHHVNVYSFIVERVAVVVMMVAFEVMVVVDRENMYEPAFENSFSRHVQRQHRRGNGSCVRRKTFGCSGVPGLAPCDK